MTTANALNFQKTGTGINWQGAPWGPSNSNTETPPTATVGTNSTLFNSGDNLSFVHAGFSLSGNLTAYDNLKFKCRGHYCNIMSSDLYLGTGFYLRCSYAMLSKRIIVPATSTGVVIDIDQLFSYGSGSGIHILGEATIRIRDWVSYANTFFIADNYSGITGPGKITLDIGCLRIQKTSSTAVLYLTHPSPGSVVKGKIGYIAPYTTNTAGQFNLAGGSDHEVDLSIANLNIARAMTTGAIAGTINIISASSNCTTETITAISPMVVNLTNPGLMGTLSWAGSTATKHVISSSYGIQNVVFGDTEPEDSTFTSCTLSNAGGLRTTDTVTETALFQAYDTLGSSYTTFATLTAGNPPTFDLGASTTIGGASMYYVGGPTVVEADGGTGETSYLNGEVLIGNSGTGGLDKNRLSAGANIDITNGAGSITIEALVPPIIWNYTYTTAKPYTVLTSDYVIGCDNTGGPCGVELPDAPTTGSEWIIKDVGGAASAVNVIDVTTVTGVVLIDGNANYGIDVAYGSAKFTWNGSSYIVS